MSSPNNVVLITGGARGIGAAIARQLANPATAVVITYNTSKAQADATIADLLKAGAAGALAIQADLTQSAAVKNVVDTVVSTYGKITGLVNNAGIYMATPIAEVDESQYTALFDSNVKSTVLITAAAAPHMPDGSSIVNISSSITHGMFAEKTMYAASKGAIDAFTRALAAELAPRKIRVNSLAPGYTATDMFPEQFHDFGRSVTPFNEVATADDVASVAAFLISGKSKWVTGQYISSSGGLVYSY